MCWPEVALDNICSLLSGNAWSASKFKDEGIIPIIRIQNLGNNVNEKFIWWNESYDDRFVVTKGDILLSLSGSIKIDIWNGEPALLNQRIVKMTPNEGVDNRWFYWQINSIILEIEKMGKWALVNNVSITDLKLIKIPLPPLENQKRIADILDAADALRQKDQELLKKYDEFAKAYYYEILKKTKVQSLKISNIIEQGKNKIRSGPFGSDLLHSEFVDSGIAVLGIDNIVNNRFEFSKSRFITEEKFRKLSRYQVFKDDVLITIMGTVGRSAVVPDNIKIAINTKHIVAMTLDAQKVNPNFISYTLTKNDELIRQIKRKSKGAIMDGLNIGIIKDLEIELPSIEEQNKFAKILKKIEDLKSTLMKSNSENFTAAVIQKAFNGELVT
jgi:type I restriction enzyme, S subunit